MYIMMKLQQYDFIKPYTHDIILKTGTGDPLVTVINNHNDSNRLGVKYTSEYKYSVES